MTVRSVLPLTDPAVMQDRLDRITMLDEEQRLMALQFLSGFAPETLDLVLEAVEPCGGMSPAEDDAEPYCQSCDASIGVFDAFDNAWWHYRDGEGGKPEPYAADHRTVLGWRIPL